jgi:hypothetical protein
MKKLLVALLSLPIIGSAQVQLGPTINNGVLPLSADSIQAFVPFIDSTSAFVSGGFQQGDVVDDFVLYDTASNPYQLSQILNSGKPVFLTSGSYSCPAYRYCMDQVVPDLVALFGTQVVFLNVYQLEAHPINPYVSPYSGTVYTTSQNFTDNVLLPQEHLYGERRNVAARSMVAMGSPCPVLIDGPGNEFWSDYGPSPNNAYLITPQGWVYSKYGWLSQNKLTAIADIQAMLQEVGVNENTFASSWIMPMANPGNSLTRLTSVSPETFTLRVFDGAGQIVLEMSVSSGSQVLLGEALPAEGMYFIEIIAEEHYESFSFLRAE